MLYGYPQCIQQWDEYSGIKFHCFGQSPNLQQSKLLEANIEFHMGHKCPQQCLTQTTVTLRVPLQTAMATLQRVFRTIISSVSVGCSSFPLSKEYSHSPMLLQILLSNKKHFFLSQQLLFLCFSNEFFCHTTGLWETTLRTRFLLVFLLLFVFSFFHLSLTQPTDQWEIAKVSSR